MTRSLFVPIVGTLLVCSLHAARTPMMTVPALGKTTANIEAVHMLNGDVISGKFLKFDPQLGLVWEAKNIKPALQVDPAAIERVTFIVESPVPSGQSRVLLANGNTFSGQLDLVNTERVAMSHTPAGPIEFKRSQLKAIIPTTGGSGRVVFSGPESEKDWVFGSSKNAVGGIGLLVPGLPPPGAQKAGAAKFQFKDNAITSTGSGATAGRKVEYPEKALIEFDLEWSAPRRNSGYFSLNVNLFTDNLKSPSNSSSYALKLSQTGANLIRQSKQNGNGMAGRIGPNARVNLTGIGSSVRFSLRANKKTRSFILSINGVQVANWKDKEPFAGKGNGLLFTSRAPYTLKISNIRISEWDGRKPLGLENTTVNPKQDIIRLVNEDTIKGTITRIGDGKIKIKSSFGEIDVPLANSHLIQFAISDNAAAASRPGKGLVIATLRGSSKLDFKLLSWEKDNLQVESPVFGKATLNGAWIESITFNARKTRAKSNKPLSKKELKKRLREKEKGNFGRPAPRVPKQNK